MLAIVDRTITTHDLILTLSDNKTITLRSDCPIPFLREEELAEMEIQVLSLHNTFVENMSKVIANDSYVQLTREDTVSLAKDGQRFSLIYPKGSFLHYSPLFYLDWVPEGMLLEVIVDEEKMAKLVYKK